jgi:hypothetical protein
VVPGSPCRFQAVEGLVEPTHKLRVGGVNKVDGLGVVDHLGEHVVEEGVLDVELVHGPTQGDNQSQHSSDGDRRNDRVDGLVVAHTREVGEPPEKPMSLVPVQRSIHLELVLQRSTCLSPHWSQEASPVGVRECATDRGQNWRQRWGSCSDGEL